MKPSLKNGVVQMGALLTVCFACVPMVCAAEARSFEYEILQSSRPDGQGSYSGNVTLQDHGPYVTVNWKLKSGEAYSGVGILSGDTLGVGYGEGLSGLAVYHIEGGTLNAKWLLPSTPQNVGEYQLTGPATLDGIYRFANGTQGSVTIKPKGNSYEIVWSLSTGTYTGVGVKLGDTLVAVSGNTAQMFGVVAYKVSHERLLGVWTVAGQNGVGTEILVQEKVAQPQDNAPHGMGAGNSGNSNLNVMFGGETYHLANSVSSPGSVNLELREFLLPGETFDNYSKLLGVRLQNGGGKSPSEFTKVILQQVASKYPQAQTNQIASDADSSTIEFLIINGNQVEYDLFHYFRSPEGLASVQFVLQNRPPYDTEPKFKAEKDAHLQEWVTELQGLAPKVATILEQTKGKGQGK